MDIDEKAFVKADVYLDEHWQDMAEDLGRLIACPSVEQPAAGENAPFGKAVADALTTALDIAEKLGFPGENIDGYLGTADMTGADEETVGVLSHVDVVPVIEAEWDTPPFTAVVKNDRVYGRGALDDKGPLIASLYAGAALKYAGMPLKKTVRFMFGCNEESGCRCLEYYLGKREPPRMGFSPDAEFPLVIGEKGICHFRLTESWQHQQTDSGIALISINCGTAANIVPGSASALLRLNGASLPRETDGINIVQNGDEALITAKGKAAHGSMPEDGCNALVILINYLAEAVTAPTAAVSWLKKIVRLTEDQYFGSSMGLADKDDFSILTLAPTMLRLTERKAELTCDMRFPVTEKKELWIARLGELAAREGFELSIDGIMDPLFAEEDDPTAAKLLKAYRGFTGDNAPPLVIGGGTYAKELPGFLAFGPEFAHTPKLCHQANEYISKKDMLDAAKIYARAIWLMAQ